MQIEQFRLEPLSAQYIDLVLQWRNLDKVRSLMFRDSIISVEEHLNWFNLLQGSEKQIVKLLFYNNLPIGLINFNEIDRLNGSCYWGLYIGEEIAPKGAGTVLGYLGLTFIYEELFLDRVYAEVLNINKNSLKFHRKLGFSVLKKLEGRIKRENEILDVIKMVHQKENWEENSEYLKNIIKNFNSDN